ncbi:TonB-linked SusC/RagA family outer membrane protein [Aquimarina sp. EL_43]|uniref:SusC/RagA family TonB-linked outer membrane protein n=1 Tax=Aquimarina TaxID=290174 RepID=UPI0004718526|nr:MULTISPECIES: TonB-dependent receptor [Aquimarina]MBG6133712.1 TonB-linked SusC/RagA family outer membrane protein [Aquimarina sp. EL_35]MBG6153885.1 TonB-linked SusC/RagA family outer membrane protein [Aquimarina sp. EL_32]MBG6172085.1 TonB-linked SusC/RagA family outer membrane protein [Aquimarina sp. EL_43]
MEAKKKKNQCYSFLLTLLGLTLFGFANTYAQNAVITGNVSENSSGSPLPGVTITIKGNETQGTQTDFDGNYSIEVSDSQTTLVYRYLGFVTKEVLVGNQTIINISLEEDAQSLGEVVLVGYGTQKKSELTAAITSVNIEEIQKIPTADIATSLQGQVAGLNVAIASGAPGSAPVIRIRGMGTVNNNDPLFVIDGVPGDLSYVNPADIENISILRDASAATIYGSRASNGVVIVTTKRGKRGDPRVVVNSYISTHSIDDNIKVANRAQHDQIKLEAYANVGETPAPYLTNGEQYADSDWADAYYKNAFEQKHDIGISGGSENTTYNFSAGYFANSGTVINTDFNRFNTRLNMDIKLLDNRLKISPGLAYAKEKRRSIFEPLDGGNASFSPFLNIYSQLPHKAIYDANSLNGFATPATGLGSGNPIGQGELTDRIDRDEYTQFNIAANLKLFDGLSYQFQYGLNVENEHFFFFQPAYNFGPQSINEDPFLSETRSRTTSWTLNNTLNYVKTFGDHDFDVLVGGSKEENVFNSAGGSNNRLPSDAIQALSAGIGDASSFGRNFSSTLQSIFGRLSYDYANRYYVQASARRDGSSRFSSKNQYGTFYSVSLGWAVHNENFFKSDLFTQLKPRFSYGTLGNQLIPNHLFLARIGSGGQQLNYPFGEDVTQAILSGAIATSLPTPDIRWEETATTNVGIDLGLLDNRIKASFDYFNAKTTDMLVFTKVPGTSGITTDPLTNAGDLENKGWEFSATYSSKQYKDFSFDVTANLSTSKNKITKLGVEGEARTDGFIEFNNFPTTRTEVGGEIGRFYLFEANGIFQNQAEIDAHGVQPDAAPGDLRFTDVNGDGELNDDDKKYMGSGLPDFEYGLTLNAKYKNFDISVFFQGTQGNKIYNGVKMWLYRTDRNNVSSDLVNAWTPQNTNTNIPRNAFGDPNNNIRPSSYFLEDGSYLRLKNLQIGYSIPESAISKIPVSRIRVYATANNLFTITDYSGFDPGLGNGGTFNRGVDRGFYPLTRSFIFGINVSM